MRMHENDAEVSGREPRVIGEDAVREIVECTGEFDSSEASAGDDDSEERATAGRIGFAMT